MDRRRFFTGLCAAVVGSVAAAGCGGSGGSNIPEEQVITQERSDEMVKQLQESQKKMKSARPR